MKTLKGRFIKTNILMAAISVAWVILVPVLLLFVYSLNRKDGLPVILQGVMGLFEGPGGSAGGVIGVYPVAGAFLIVFLVVITCIALSANLSRAVLLPIRELKRSAENIVEGSLGFDVMSCEDEELNDLCQAFEEIRKKLRENAEKEVRIEEERSVLMANISHDMRTPITTIKGYLEGIQDGVADSPEKLEKYLTTIYSKTLVLERLVDSITEYSELELGRMQYVFEFVDLTEYLKDLAEEYRMDVEELGLAFHTQFLDRQLTVVADRGKLKRVLDNLIGNSIKYNQEGGSISLQTQTDGRGALICVSDTGSGIKNEDIKSVFDGFYRGDAARDVYKRQV